MEGDYCSDVVLSVGCVLLHVVFGAGEDRVFNVSPANMDIPPLKSCAFLVTFRPVSVAVPMRSCY